jgi:2,3-dihydroxybenzoate decarboxylase
MQGKIALEEHFAMDDTVQDSAGFAPTLDWIELKARLLDIHERRLAEMDAHGIELMLLSLNAPAVQAIPDRDRALDLSRRANDFLAEQVARRPDRFQGLAALPMQDPEAAARELDRCVSTLGFRGALVNGFSELAGTDHAIYYDRKESGRSGRRPSVSAFPFICIRAIRWRRMRRSTKDIAGCWGRPGRSGRRPRCTPCA